MKRNTDTTIGIIKFENNRQRKDKKTNELVESIKIVEREKNESAVHPFYSHFRYLLEKFTSHRSLHAFVSWTFVGFVEDHAFVDFALLT